MSSIGLKILSKFYKIHYNPIEISFNNFESFKKTAENSTYVVFDKNLGWDIIKNGSAMDSFYVSNDQGIRRKNNIGVRKKKIRISSYGDSFVHCDDVSNENTWQSFIEQREKKFEVLNLGVGGYGTDQAFLKYKLTQKNLDADMVLIGYMTENSNRNVNTYRPFYIKNTQDINFSKPRFIYEKNQLRLIPNYFSSLNQMEVLAKKPKEHFNLLGADDYFFNNSYKSSLFDFLPSIRFINISMDKICNSLVLEKQYSDNSEMFIVTKNIIEQFYREVVLNNSLPLIVVFPNKWDVLELMRGNKLRYLGLLNFFEKNNLQYIDLISIFNNIELTREIIYNDLFIPHYSPFVNSLVANEIINKIDEIYSINKNISDN